MQTKTLIIDGIEHIGFDDIVLNKPTKKYVYNYEYKKCKKECPQCGCIISYKNVARHKRSDKHQVIVKLLYDRFDIK